MNEFESKVALHRKELLRSQQGELNAALMYQRLAKVVKTDKERNTFLQLAKEEGHHASVFHAYTKEALKPKKLMAVVIPIMYRLWAKNACILSLHKANMMPLLATNILFPTSRKWKVSRMMRCGMATWLHVY